MYRLEISNGPEEGFISKKAVLDNEPHARNIQASMRLLHLPHELNAYGHPKQERG